MIKACKLRLIFPNQMNDLKYQAYTFYKRLIKNSFDLLQIRQCS